jgi:hypothetical protein
VTYTHDAVERHLLNDLYEIGGEDRPVIWRVRNVAMAMAPTIDGDDTTV